MKRLLALLSIPLISGVISCVHKEPVESDYFTGTSPISIDGYLNATAKDLDKDGQGEAIISSTGQAIYYVKGYENSLNITKKTLEMTPELREDVTNYIRADNSLRFHAAKLEYERYLRETDTTGVKK